jgi:hypothetical protein
MRRGEGVLSHRKKTVLSVCCDFYTSRFDRLVDDWLVDNMTPHMTLYLFSLNVNVPMIQQTYTYNLIEASINHTISVNIFLDMDSFARMTGSELSAIFFLTIACKHKSIKYDF